MIKVQQANPNGKKKLLFFYWALIVLETRFIFEGTRIFFFYRTFKPTSLNLVYTLKYHSLNLLFCFLT